MRACAPAAACAADRPSRARLSPGPLRRVQAIADGERIEAERVAQLAKRAQEASHAARELSLARASDPASAWPLTVEANACADLLQKAKESLEVQRARVRSLRQRLSAHEAAVQSSSLLRKPLDARRRVSLAQEACAAAQDAKAVACAALKEAGARHQAALEALAQASRRRLHIQRSAERLGRDGQAGAALDVAEARLASRQSALDAAVAAAKSARAQVQAPNEQRLLAALAEARDARHALSAATANREAALARVREVNAEVRAAGARRSSNETERKAAWARGGDERRTGAERAAGHAARMAQLLSLGDFCSACAAAASVRAWLDRSSPDPTLGERVLSVLKAQLEGDLLATTCAVAKVVRSAQSERNKRATAEAGVWRTRLAAVDETRRERAEAADQARREANRCGEALASALTDQASTEVALRASRDEAEAPRALGCRAIEDLVTAALGLRAVCAVRADEAARAKTEADAAATTASDEEAGSEASRRSVALADALAEQAEVAESLARGQAALADRLEATLRGGKIASACRALQLSRRLDADAVVLRAARAMHDAEVEHIACEATGEGSDASGPSDDPAARLDEASGVHAAALEAALASESPTPSEVAAIALAERLGQHVMRAGVAALWPLCEMSRRASEASREVGRARDALREANGRADALQELAADATLDVALLRGRTEHASHVAADAAQQADAVSGLMSGTHEDITYACLRKQVAAKVFAERGVAKSALEVAAADCSVADAKRSAAVAAADRVASLDASIRAQQSALHALRAETHDAEMSAALSECLHEARALDSAGLLQDAERAIAQRAERTRALREAELALGWITGVASDLIETATAPEVEVDSSADAGAHGEAEALPSQADHRRDFAAAHAAKGIAEAALASARAAAADAAALTPESPESVLISLRELTSRLDALHGDMATAESTLEELVRERTHATAELESARCELASAEERAAVSNTLAVATSDALEAGRDDGSSMEWEAYGGVGGAAAARERGLPSGPTGATGGPLWLVWVELVGCNALVFRARDAEGEADAARSREQADVSAVRAARDALKDATDRMQTGFGAAAMSDAVETVRRQESRHEVLRAAQAAHEGALRLADDAQRQVDAARLACDAEVQRGAELERVRAAAEDARDTARKTASNAHAAVDALRDRAAADKHSAKATLRGATRAMQRATENDVCTAQQLGQAKARVERCREALLYADVDVVVQRVLEIEQRRVEEANHVKGLASAQSERDRTAEDARRAAQELERARVEREKMQGEWERAKADLQLARSAAEHASEAVGRPKVNSTTMKRVSRLRGRIESMGARAAIERDTLQALAASHASKRALEAAARVAHAEGVEAARVAKASVTEREESVEAASKTVTLAEANCDALMAEMGAEQTSDVEKIAHVFERREEAEEEAAELRAKVGTLSAEAEKLGAKFVELDATATQAEARVSEARGRFEQLRNADKRSGGGHPTGRAGAAQGAKRAGGSARVALPPDLRKCMDAARRCRAAADAASGARDDRTRRSAAIMKRLMIVEETHKAEVDAVRSSKLAAIYDAEDATRRAHATLETASERHALAVEELRLVEERADGLAVALAAASERSDEARLRVDEQRQKVKEMEEAAAASLAQLTDTRTEVGIAGAALAAREETERALAAATKAEEAAGLAAEHAAVAAGEADVRDADARRAATLAENALRDAQGRAQILADEIKTEHARVAGASWAPAAAIVMASLESDRLLRRATEDAADAAKKCRAHDEAVRAARANVESVETALRMAKDDLKAKAAELDEARSLYQTDTDKLAADGSPLAAAARALRARNEAQGSVNADTEGVTSARARRERAHRVWQAACEELDRACACRDRAEARHNFDKAMARRAERDAAAETAALGEDGLRLASEKVAQSASAWRTVTGLRAALRLADDEHQGAIARAQTAFTASNQAHERARAAREAASSAAVAMARANARALEAIEEASAASRGRTRSEGAGDDGPDGEALAAARALANAQAIFDTAAGKLEVCRGVHRALADRAKRASENLCAARIRADERLEAMHAAEAKLAQARERARVIYTAPEKASRERCAELDARASAMELAVKRAEAKLPEGAASVLAANVAAESAEKRARECASALRAAQLASARAQAAHSSSLAIEAAAEGCARSFEREGEAALDEGGDPSGLGAEDALGASCTLARAALAGAGAAAQTAELALAHAEAEARAAAATAAGLLHAAAAVPSAASTEVADDGEAQPDTTGADEMIAESVEVHVAGFRRDEAERVLVRVHSFCMLAQSHEIRASLRAAEHEGLRAMLKAGRAAADAHVSAGGAPAAARSAVASAMATAADAAADAARDAAREAEREAGNIAEEVQAVEAEERTLGDALAQARAAASADAQAANDARRNLEEARESAEASRADAEAGVAAAWEELAAEMVKAAERSAELVAELAAKRQMTRVASTLARAKLEVSAEMRPSSCVPASERARCARSPAKACLSSASLTPVNALLCASVRLGLGRGGGRISGGCE